ncbi:DUF885 domain-containing protein [Congregibacter variabilis]|uniref:DUF885 domain-containing protein n=1 Tax=Congregibacter variabilis TaxID=3081200 RepID=A0ABZ0I280_9GAMM|nr:DUF885 domain-containing protein [Congregibacter sp. IMCC43200]
MLRLPPSLLLLLLIGCSDSNVPLSTQQEAAAPLGPVAAETRRFNNWLDKEYHVETDFSPLSKSRRGDKSAHGELDDVSESALASQLQWRRDSVARMQSEFQRAALDEEAQRSWDLREYQLERQEWSQPFQRHRFIFGRNGPQSRFPNNLINYHEVSSESDMQDYVSRLRQSGRYLRQYLVRAQLAAEEGIRAPYFDYERAISEIDRVITGEPFSDGDSSALWADISGKLAALLEAAIIDAKRADELSQAARAALLGELKPAYQEIRAWLVADFPNVSEEAQGAWSLPNGEAYYAARLSTMTTLPLTAEEIYQTGAREVARIQNEMEGIKRQVGFEGSLQEFFNFLREDDQFFLPNTDEGRQAYLDLADQYLKAMYAKLPDYFGILPKAGLQVRRVEAFREQAGGSAHYARGTPDGSRPGTFYAHLADMRAVAVNRLENLSYHEGVPGHHMQISIQQELDNIPQFRAYARYTAFSEGWGLYSELLGKEMGGYEDPYADFGRLSGEIWRAVRLVVDTGIHAKGWSEEEAVQYALANSSRPELSVRSEVRRYFNNPGQATAYKIGMLKIQEYRARAESELGDAFDIRAFHDVVLGSGPLPMAVLQTKVDNWIESVRQSD